MQVKPRHRDIKPPNILALVEAGHFRSTDEAFAHVKQKRAGGKQSSRLSKSWGYPPRRSAMDSVRSGMRRRAIDVR